MRRLTDKDVLSGLVFATLGLLGLWLGGGYEAGTAVRMGPGFMPRVLSWALLALGVVVAARGLTRAVDPAEAMSVRGLVLVTLAILAFGYLIESWGLLIAGAALLILGRLADPGAKATETAALTVGLLALCTVIFLLILELPITALPR